MLLKEIAGTYFRPKTVIRNKLRSTTEGQAFAYLLLGCILHLCGRIPRLQSDTVSVQSDVPFYGALVANLFGSIFLAPFLFYLVAAFVRILIKIIGIEVSWLHSRMALFWTVLIVFPLAFINGVVWSLTNSEKLYSICQIILLFVFLGFWVKALYVSYQEGLPVETQTE